MTDLEEGLNKACFTLTCLASHGQRASLPSGKKNERKKKTANLIVACWNVRTMQDSDDRPERRSALVARELARLDIFKRASLPSIESILLKVQLRWAGHVTTMEYVSMQKQSFF